MPMTPEELDEFNRRIKATDDVDKLKKIVSELAEKVAIASDKAEKFASSFGEAVKLIGSTDSLFLSIGQSLKSSVISIKDFTKSLSTQYRLSEELAKNYKQTSINIGIGYQNQKILSDEFNRAVVLVEQLGGNVDDVKGIYTKFSQESGRVRILDEEEVQRIFAIEKATGLLGDSATALSERFDLMGVGSEQFAENINQIVKDSQKLGLNSSKVVQVLSDNFASMQRMSFRGGVKAMTEMSKLAVKMRMDISDMLGMADRFYEPESAIEAAAQMQLLGGEMASAFGDPMQMMFDARNAPEEFARKVGEATKGMVQFNEETGQFDMVAENRQRLIGMADALGINKDQLIDTAFQMNKMQRIKMDVGGNLFDEDTMDKISSLAKFDKTSGQWTVDVSGEAVAVEDLNTEQIEQALATPSTEEDAIIETAKASMTTNEHLVALVQSTKTSIANETRLYERIEKLVSPRLGNMKEVMDGFVELTSEAFNTPDITNAISNSINISFDIFDSSVNTFSDAIVDLEKVIKEDLSNLKKISPVKVTGEKDINIGKKIIEKQTAQDLYSGPGDSNRVLTGSFGSFQLDNRDLVAAGDPKKLLSSVNTPQEINVGGKFDGNNKLDNIKDNLIMETITEELLSSVNSNQKLDVSGTINFGNINISMDGSSETISFTEKDKKEMMESVKYQIIAGVNSMIGAGKRPGKDALVGT